MDLIAERIAALLSNGAGGFDWSALPLMCAWLGVDDIEGLLQRLAVMRMHRPSQTLREGT